MKSLLLVLTLSVTAYAFVINVPTSPSAGKGIGRLELIYRQKLLLSLFNNVCEKSTDSYIIRQASEFTADFFEGFYKDPEVLSRFKTIVQKGALPENEIFSELNTEHYNEFLTMRDMFTNAKDFDTFFAVAAWARQNLNCGLYVSALYSAIIYRADTNKLYIPPPYEILPNYFFKKDAIIAGAYLLSGEDVAFENVRNDGNSYIVSVNYTSDIEDDASSNRLAYFNEDIGMNTFIFLKNLMFENSMQTGLDKLEVSEQIYHLMKQLSTRYELERYSNDVYDSMDLDWIAPITDNYDPMLMYSNGKDFSSRTGTMDVSNVECIELLKNIESSVTSIISKMVQNNFTKTDILKTLVETLVTGENSYAKIAFRNIGKTLDVTDGTPSSLEHYMTLARDPMFWKVNKKIVTIIENALTILPTYTRNELYFPGVQINNADIKKITTSFENFIVDTTEALKPLSSNVTFQFKVEQPRLNHKPFSIKFNITSVVSQKCIIKVFLAPKLMPGELAKNQRQFMLLDYFQVSLKKGVNSVTRSSIEMNSLSDDFLSFRTIEKYVEDAQFGLDTLHFESIKRFTGFPSRLAIPKGSEDGLPFQLFVFVAPLTKVIILDSGSKRIEYNNAALSSGYPLDLFVDDDMLFDLPNALVKEIIITHKKVGAGKSGDFKKPYNKPTSYEKGEESNAYDKWETNKPNLKSSGFAEKTETSKKSKGTINEKAKSDKNMTPSNIYDDEIMMDITNNPLNANKYPSYSFKSKVNTINPKVKTNKIINIDSDIADKNIEEKNKIINKSFDNTNKSVKENKITKNMKIDYDDSIYMNDKSVQDDYYGDEPTSKTFKSENLITDSFDNIKIKDSKFEGKTNKIVNSETDPSFDFTEKLPKTIISKDQTFERFGKVFNKSLDNIDISKNYAKDSKINKVFNIDSKINKNIKIDGAENSFDMKAEIIPKFIFNSEKSTKTVGKIYDPSQNIIDGKNIVMRKDINNYGSKKITISDIDDTMYLAKVTNAGQDKSFVKTINTENTTDKNADVSSFNVLKLSETKDFIKGNASDVHKKILIDDHNSTDKNTDISIDKDDGTNVEIHRIWDGPVLEMVPVEDNKQPSVHEYPQITSAKYGLAYDDYEVYE